jgi:hypothetical protein
VEDFQIILIVTDRYYYYVMIRWIRLLLLCDDYLLLCDDQVEDFQIILPLLQELSKESIKRRHWEEIVHICGGT